MEQGQVLDKGRRLRCGHLVGKGRRTFVRYNMAGDALDLCFDCQARRMTGILQPPGTSPRVQLPMSRVDLFREWLAQW